MQICKYVNMQLCKYVQTGAGLSPHSKREPLREMCEIQVRICQMPPLVDDVFTAEAGLGEDSLLRCHRLNSEHRCACVCEDFYKMINTSGV